MIDNPLSQRSNEIYESLHRFKGTLQEFYERLNELLRESDDERTASQVLNNIENILRILDEHSSELTAVHDNSEGFLIGANFLISGGQHTPLVCQLPHHTNPPHYFYHGYICQTNPQHVFCRKHQLSQCVLCGGNLK
jgi:hypothetical protein